VTRAAAFGALLLAGCWLDFGSFAVCGTPEGNPCPTDGEVVEAGSDSGPVSLDAGWDAGLLDAATDAGGLDAALPDASTDAGRTPDAGHDAGPRPPCADGSEGDRWSETMSGCSVRLVVQADASSLCGEGWHLCTPSEYFDRGGSGIEPLQTFWLSACLDATGCPRSGVCDGSEGETTYSTRSCAGIPVSSGTYPGPMGLTTDVQKRVVSCGACAYWTPRSIDATAGAVCCR